MRPKQDGGGRRRTVFQGRGRSGIETWAQMVIIVWNHKKNDVPCCAGLGDGDNSKAARYSTIHRRMDRARSDTVKKSVM
jgi:hypothetical protein